jgi:hypothetical protein
MSFLSTVLAMSMLLAFSSWTEGLRCQLVTARPFRNRAHWKTIRWSLCLLGDAEVLVVISIGLTIVHAVPRVHALPNSLLPELHSRLLF